jgi:predicted trehalose synthase
MGGVAMSDVRRAARVLAALLLGLAVLAGCANQAAPTTPVTRSATPTPTAPELCLAAANFQTAANTLTQIDATASGIDGVKAALQSLRDAGRNLATAAKAQFAEASAALGRAVDTLQQTMASITTPADLLTQLGGLTTAVAQVEAAAATIVANVRAGCPDVPPVATPTP